MAKILIVDDNEDNRALLAYLLDRRGHTTVLAASGEAGVEAAASEAPDLILMDLVMPVLDGEAAACLIRKQEALASTPILAMSAAYTTPLEHNGSEAGPFDGFFALPMDLSAWVSQIEAHLEPAAAKPGGAEGGR